MRQPKQQVAISELTWKDGQMEFDPQLSILRSCIRALPDKRTRTDLETARYKLYAALDVKDTEHAKRWAEALRVGLLAQLSGQPTINEQELVKAARAALEEITKGLN